jgi:hypothetical protein
MEQTQRQNAPKQVYETAWPDMFASLQTAYAELTRAQFELVRRTAEMEVGRDFLTKPLDLNKFPKIVKSIEDFWLKVVRLPPEE